MTEPSLLYPAAGSHIQVLLLPSPLKTLLCPAEALIWNLSHVQSAQAGLARCGASPLSLAALLLSST